VSLFRKFIPTVRLPTNVAPAPAADRKPAPIDVATNWNEYDVPTWWRNKSRVNIAKLRIDRAQRNPQPLPCFLTRQAD
jgi:hypothetical protein